MKSKPLRYAHAEGHTDLCFTDDGNSILTCGNDGDVRVWAGIEDDDPTSHCIGQWALAICFKDNRVFVSIDNNAVQAYTYPGFDKDGIVTRFSAPVNHIMTSKKIEVLGCASENTEARLCSYEGGAPVLIMSEHKGPVISISVCPNLKYASTSCGDGLLRIWHIESQKVVKEINCVPKVNSFYSAKVLCRTSFHPNDGRYLAYPSNREVIVLDIVRWVNTLTLTHNNIKCPISQCAYSPCGKYIAASTVAGQIVVWNTESSDSIDIIEHPTSHNVTSIVWNPKGNGVLAYCDNSGQLGVIENCYGMENLLENHENIEIIDKADDLVDDLINHYESDDDENAISLEKLKNETLLRIDKDDSRAPSPETRSSHIVNTVPPQQAFQPSATPTHLEHRYMCWNDVGIVRCHASTNDESNIEVEFHDTSTHHGIHLNNYLCHTMASLSQTVLALACETPSKMVCISLQGSSKEWSVSMTGTEEILCIVATSGLVACATSARNLRIYTPMGTQRQVVSIAGPIVALTGYGKTIMLVYHRTDPGVSDQHLSMDIIAFQGQQIRCKTVSVPLSPGSKLSWLGTTDCGSPCIYDSYGVLRMYNVSAAVWFTICNTSDHCKGASDSWFIVSVSEITQTVRAILCRGASFPLTVPKPTILQLPIQLPLCELETEKGQYEEQLARWSLMNTEVEAKTKREVALKLFALACRNEVEQRAIELMDLLKDNRLLPLAVKYASRLGRMHLVDKLTNMAEEWEQEDDRINDATHFQQIESQDCMNGENGDNFNASLIIPQKSSETKIHDVTPIKPAPLKAMGSRNPFKKHNVGIKNSNSPLSLTDRNTEVIEEEPEDPMKPRNGETFVDWFSRNKEALEKENAGLTPAEMTKHGIKVFRNLQPRNWNNNGDIGQKRKSIDESNGYDMAIPSTSKQARLSEYSFEKKSA